MTPGPGCVCVDASFVVEMLGPPAVAARYFGQWQRWGQAGLDVIGPPLLFAETTSVIRNHVYFGRMTPTEGEQVFAAFLQLRIRQVDLVDLQQRAWQLARTYNLPRAYDTQYVAVAQHAGCELWTADGRLANAVPLSWIKHL